MSRGAERYRGDGDGGDAASTHGRPGEATSSSPPIPMGGPPPVEERSTGLPWPRTWNGLYGVVGAAFVLWILLLALLARLYR